MTDILYCPYLNKSKTPVGALHVYEEATIRLRITKSYNIYDLKIIVENDTKEVLRKPLYLIPEYDNFYNVCKQICFVQNGKIIFACLGDHHFDASINGLVPISTTWPSMHSEEDIDSVIEQVQLFITSVGFKTGCVNIESRINTIDGKAYLIDIGARSGGNYTPFVIQYATGFNFVEAMLDFSMEHTDTKQIPVYNGYYAYMVMHSKEAGILKGITIAEKLKSHILERHDYIKRGQNVRSFRGANAACGVLLVKFDSNEQMQDYVNHMNSYVKVCVLNI